MAKRSLLIIIALSVVLVIAICVSIWALFFREGEEVLPPDYPPLNTDGNQEPIPNDQGGEIVTPAGGGAVNVTYAENITVDLSEKRASIYYANPSRSNQNVAIAIVIDNEVIIRSALITPGNMVTSLPLVDGAESKLTAGVYKAEIIIYCYHPETGEKAIIDTKGELVVTVIE